MGVLQRSLPEVAMPSGHPTIVRGKDGWCGTVMPPASQMSSDPEHVLVQLENGEQLLVPTAVMNRYGYDLATNERYHGCD